MQNSGQETQRIEAFSDGVFAIAITLLILDIHVPLANGEPLSWGLSDALLREWPSYVSFVMSFLTILVMWVNHHRMFHLISRTDNRFLILNGLLLLGITAIPFPTALLSQYILQPDAKIAAAVYSGTLVYIAAMYNVVWMHAAQYNLLMDQNYEADDAARITAQYRFGPIFYVVTFVVALVSPLASVGCCLALAIYFATPGFGFSVTRRLF